MIEKYLVVTKDGGKFGVMVHRIYGFLRVGGSNKLIPDMQKFVSHVVKICEPGRGREVSKGKTVFQIPLITYNRVKGVSELLHDVEKISESGYRIYPDQKKLGRLMR